MGQEPGLLFCSWESCATRPDLAGQRGSRFEDAVVEVPEVHSSIVVGRSYTCSLRFQGHKQQFFFQSFCC